MGSSLASSPESPTLMDLARLSRPSDDQDEPFIPDLSEGVEGGLYLALFELLDEGLVITGDETILEANSAACRLLERGYGELVGQPLAELFPSEQAFLAARGRMFIQGQMRGSLQIALPGGRRRDMRFCAAARLRPGVHALVLSPDYLAEAAAPASPADPLWPRLAAALEQPVIVVDDEARIAAANAATLRRLRLSRTELVGLPLEERLTVRWPAAGGEPLAQLRLPSGEELAARLLPGPKPGWRLLILPAEPENRHAPAAPLLPAALPPPAGVSGSEARRAPLRKQPKSAPPQVPARTAARDARNNLDLANRALEASLAQAIERQELEIHFAPEWRLGASRPAAEALLRWRHRELGLIPCGHLLPVLRQAGLLADFGAWTLEQACAQAARWTARGRPVPVVVNVAAEQLADPAFAARLRGFLKDQGLAPATLELDLEESLLAEDDARQRVVLDELAGLGVGLAIDNFGQGLSSIPRLARLPITRLRLDPALVREGLGTPAPLEATLAMAYALGLKVGAKGVDDAAAQARLVDLGCTALQGRHIGAPVDPAGFAQRHLA
jgi:EAL domain-containing protein (putative c-di-GMP-specific phosphodiesterase class I)/PAS domain-containing protein